MEHYLENEKLKVKIVSKGAELKSLLQKEKGRELMWRADPRYWGRTAPVLFPQVGKVIDDTYTYEGKAYHLPQHGFARDREFALVSGSQTELWMRLEADDESLAVYPFDFQLDLGYRLEESALQVLWKVTNKGSGEMYFSIGGHPAFACPIGEEDKGYEGYYLDFHTGKKSLVNSKFGIGYVSKEKEDLNLEADGSLRITEDLFANDALVIEGNQTQAVSLMTPQKEPYLTVSFDAPLFGVWSPPGKNAPFVCIEPWYGRADKEDFAGDLAQRDWEQHLAAGEVFQASYRIQPN